MDKFRVHIYDFGMNKTRSAPIGRFEIYDASGEFIGGSGKRRIKNYDPVSLDAIPRIIIQNRVGIDKKLTVNRIGNEVNEINISSTRSRPHRPQLRPRDVFDGLDEAVNTVPPIIYEVTCEQAD